MNRRDRSTWARSASSWLEAHGKSFRGVGLPRVTVRDAELQLHHFLAHA